MPSSPSTGDAIGTQAASTLTPKHKETLLRLARLTLREHLADRDHPDYHTDVAALREHRAAFVSLTRRSSRELRGCRGECPARRPLVDAVTQMVVASATDDPRFLPVTADELADLRIEISALTPLEPIRSEDVIVGQHGLVIVKSGATGLLLPQVPVNQGWDRQAFLNGLCQKAGLAPTAWHDGDAVLFAFEAEVWSE